MSASAARRISLLVVLTAIAGAAAGWAAAATAAGWAAAGWAAAASPAFHAEPQVQVIELAANGSGSGSIVLHNDTAGAIVVGSITAEPGCDAAAVHASPLTGFMLPAGMTRSIAITCTPAPASMQRCDYRVRSPTSAVLLELEAVCAYAGASGPLSPDATAIDFGIVPVGGVASRTIALQNTGAASLGKLFIETTDLTGNFAVAAPCNPDARECDAAIPSVPAGGTTSVVVTCTPRADGTQNAQLHIATSAGTRLPAPISLTCTGMAVTTPVISVLPSSIDVGAVELVNATAHATVHVANAGSDMLKLTDVQIVDDGAGAAPDWTYTAHAPCSPGVPPACVLIGGQTVDLDLVFDPSAIGARDATLLVNYHDTADRSTSIPLHGIGRGATLDLVGGQTVLDFGVLPLNATATLTFQVANRGTRDLTDGSLSVTPVGPPFTVTPGPSFMVASSAPATITASCKPTAATMVTAVLHLTAPDDQSSPIDVTLRCAGDATMALTATPPAVLLGEVRLATQVIKDVAVASSSPATLVTAGLETVNPSMTVSGAPAPTPAMIHLKVDPQVEGDLADRIMATVAPNSGPQIAIAVTGAAVSAAYSVPAVVSLGTFCVEQPTTPRIVELTSIGSATIAVLTPALQSSDSHFDLQLLAPLTYPAALAPLQRASVAATPRRQTVAGLAADDVIWTTDVAGAITAHTRLTATFADNGGAITPSELRFPPTTIHLDTRNAQQVTLQNCDVSALQLQAPQISAPFSIDSPAPPDMLRAGETVTFSVGFHPTKVGDVTKMLTITSPQLRNPLTVMLTGTGIVSGGDSDGGVTTTSLEHTSFYACSSCASNGAGDPGGAIVFTLSVICTLVPRCRHRHRSELPRRRPPRSESA